VIGAGGVLRPDLEVHVFRPIEGPTVNDPTRRGFLVIAGAGAAAAGVAAVAPAVSATPTAAAKPAGLPQGVSGPLVAYVTDMRGGELTLMVGEREVVVHDADLAARLARAAH
jgi:hypothetical protein